jgi:raffinose/stachyose/melibiose transport system permease protein
MPSRAKKRALPAAWAFVLPALVLYLAFTILPLAAVLADSLFRWRGIALDGFAGLANFATLAAPTILRGEIVNAFGNNCIFFLGTLFLQNIFGLGLALLLHNRKRGRQFFQTVFALPFLVNPLVVGYAWTLLLNPIFGPVAGGLEALGLDFLIRPWLGEPGWARPMAILINAWQWVGFPMLVFGAALGGIGEEIFQAASLEQASRWQILRYITLPLLTPTIASLAVLTFIGCFNAFNLQYALGGVNGGPEGSNDVLGLVFYRTAFSGDLNAIGASSALAACSFAFVFAVAMGMRAVMTRIEARVT